jgi:hypothetical protein
MPITIAIFPSLDLADDDFAQVVFATVQPRLTRPASRGWEASMPLSMTATSIPRPLACEASHFRLSLGLSNGTFMGGAACLVRP